MFTGLVEEIGTVRRVSGATNVQLLIEAKTVLEGTRLGDSIAVNGTCLTVTARTDHSLTVGVIPETLRRTNLGQLRPGSPVNLERSVALGGRMGGHLVQGHVDALGRVVGKEREGNALWVTIEAPPEVMRYLVPRAFISLDGVSLTVARVEQDRFAISLIPHTQAHITLPQQPIGYLVNIEVDIIAKYVDGLLGHADTPGGQANSGGIDREYLERHGFV